MGFPGDSEGKEYACNVGDPCSIPGSGRSPGEGNGYPLQYSRYMWIFRRVEKPVSFHLPTYICTRR